MYIDRRLSSHFSELLSSIATAICQPGIRVSFHPSVESGRYGLFVYVVKKSFEGFCFSDVSKSVVKRSSCFKVHPE